MIQFAINIAFLLVTFTAGVVQADACHTRHTPMQDISKLREHFNGAWGSVNQNSIANAPCKTAAAPSVEEMEEYLTKAKSGRKLSRKVNGIEFKDEDSEMLKLFADLNKGYYGNNKNPPQHKSNCTKVMCAIQEIFGQKQGLQIAFMLQKYGYNGNHKIVSPARAWTSKELDDVLTALADLPDSMYPITYNHQLTHAPSSKNSKNLKVLADATVQMYDAWNEQPPLERQATLIHELGHNLASQSDSKLDNSPEWLNLSGWMSKRTGVSASEEGWKMIDKSQAVSRYGSTNPAEDFAETATAYRYNALQLKEASPEKYNYMKAKVFDGIEYTSEQSCRLGTITEQKRKAAKTSYENLQTSLNKSRPLAEEIMPELRSTCAGAAIDSILDKNDELDNCIIENYSKLEIQSLAKAQGKSEISLKHLNASDLRQWPVDQANLELAKRQLKQQYAKSLSTALLDRGEVFDRTKQRGTKVTANACKNDTTYSYQSIAASSDFEDLKRKDTFFFYDRNTQIANWAKNLCEKFNKGQAPLTEVVLGELP